MGISLFGLTPAATYPALIKFGDNSAISGTLRALSDGLGTDLPIQVSTAGVNFTGTASIGGAAIVTNASGVSGAIQFSNGSAFASDAANLFWDDANNRLGVGTNAPISPLNIQSDTPNVGILSVTTSGGGSNRFEVWNSNSVSTPVWNIGIPSPDTRIRMYSNILLRANGTDAATFSSNEASFGSISGARLGIRGTGSTSATTSLLVQNSAGTQLLQVRDDGTTIAQNFTGTGYFSLTSEQRLVIGTAPNRTLLRPSGDGILCILNGGETDFNRLQFGGTTSSFPAIKRNGAAIDFRLADDSGFTNISANNANLGSATTGSRLSVRGDVTNPIARFETSLGAISFGINSLGDTFNFGSGGNVMYVVNQNGSSTINGKALAWYANIDTLAGFCFSFNDNNTQSYTTGTGGMLAIANAIFSPASGSANFRPMSIQYTLNASGAQTGTATGIFLNATETALNGMGHNLMDLQNNGVSMLRVQRLGQLSSIGYSIDAARFRFNNQNYNTNFGYIQGNSNGVFSLIDNTEANFNRLQFGGTTSAFPSIKRNGAGIDFKLADDSAFAPINAGATTLRGSGSTSATTSLLVQNSAGTAAMTVKDDLSATFGGNVTTPTLTINGNWQANNNDTIFGTVFNYILNPVNIGGTTQTSSAMLEVRSTTRGFLPPVMTTTQRNAIASPAAGLTVYDSTTNKLNYNNGTTWKEITPDGYTGLVTINALPPVTFDIQNGIIVNVI